MSLFIYTFVNIDKSSSSSQARHFQNDTKHFLNAYKASVHAHKHGQRIPKCRRENKVKKSDGKRNREQCVSTIWKCKIRMNVYDCTRFVPLAFVRIWWPHSQSHSPSSSSLYLQQAGMYICTFYIHIRSRTNTPTTWLSIQWSDAHNSISNKYVGMAVLHSLVVSHSTEPCK